MADISSPRQIDDFLGSVQIFASTMQELLEAQLQEVAGTGLAFSQLRLLNLVERTEGHTISDLAGFMGVSAAAASKAVDRLVRRELLERTEVPSDRRAVHLALTPAGHDVLGRYRSRSRAVLASVFQDLPSENLLAAVKTLDKLSLDVVRGQLDTDRDVCFRCGIHFRDRCLLRQSGRACFFHLHRKAEDAPHS